MKILFLAPAPEASPLPKALAALGHEVRVAAPLRRAAPGRVLTRVAVPAVRGPQVAPVYGARRGGLLVYFIAAPRRPRGTPPPTVAEQAIHFSLAAVGLCRALDWTPDVLHALDPAYGAAIYWLATDGLHSDELGDIATVLTVDEVGAPMVGAARELNAFGLVPSDAPHLPDAARVALPGLGLAHADRLVTASAADLTQPEAGGVFAELLSSRQSELCSIAPGLDLAAWDPARDRALRQRYDAPRLERRAANKRALQRELKLPLRDDAPLVVIFAAAETPASLDLDVAALRELLWAGATAQFAVLGPTAPDPAAELKALARTFPGQLATVRRAEGGLVRRVYAGADVLLAAHPEAGTNLGVRRALRYGLAPVVTGAGGPTEGVVDVQVRRHGTGFVFSDYNAGALAKTLQRALAAQRRPASWAALQRRGMQAAAQWGEAQAAEAYVKLYQQAILVRKEMRAQLAERLAEIPATGDSPPEPGPLPQRPHEDPRRNPRRR